MSKPWNLTPPWPHNCALPDGERMVRYSLVQEIRNWCETQTQGQYWWEPGSMYIYFEYPQDCMMFQMRWH